MYNTVFQNAHLLRTDNINDPLGIIKLQIYYFSYVEISLFCVEQITICYIPDIG